MGPIVHPKVLTLDFPHVYDQRSHHHQSNASFYEKKIAMFQFKKEKNLHFEMLTALYVLKLKNSPKN